MMGYLHPISFLPHCNHRSFLRNAVNALTSIHEAHLFFKHCVCFQTLNGIPNCSGWQPGLLDDSLLGERLSALKHLVHQLCRRWQAFNIRYYKISSLFRGKNDPFWS